MILVVGATGMLGGMITRQLLEKGLPVSILVRHSSNYQPLVEAGAKPLFGDLKDPGSLQAACQGIETVITTANSIMRGGPDTVETVDLQGNISLVDAAAGAGVKHFIFISVSGADSESPIPFIAAKGKAEQHLVGSGMTYTILAPGPFTEVWIGMVVAAAIGQGLPVTTYGQGKQAFIPMKDVVSFVVSSLDNPRAMNQHLTISGCQAYSFGDAAKAFGRLAGREVPVVQVNPGDPVPTVPPSALPMMIGMSMADWSVPMEDMARQFGVRMTSMEDSIRGMLSNQPR